MTQPRKKSDQLPRGMYLRGDVYYCRIAGPDGKIIRQALSKDRKTAVLMLAELRKQQELRKVGILPDDVEHQIKTFDELRWRYLEHIKSKDAAENTVKVFEMAYKQVVLQNRFTYLRDMTLAKVESWVRPAVETGRLRGQSVNLYVGVIRTALRWAHENGYISKNSLANWKPVRQSEPKKRRDFLPEEIRAFFAAEDDPEFRLRWLVYFQTALRKSAGRDICWEWIDWDAKMLRLPLGHNKSRRKHEIPLGENLLDALRQRRDGVGGEPVGMIFTRLGRSALFRRFRRTCHKAGLNPEGLCLHSIRHTVATTIYERTGKNLKLVQEILGHADPGTTMRYLHVAEEEKRRAINTLDFSMNIDTLGNATSDSEANEDEGPGEEPGDLSIVV